MRLKTMAVIAGMVMVLYGCLSVGRPFESDDLSWIRKNNTAKDDVYDELGESPSGWGVIRESLPGPTDTISTAPSVRPAPRIW